MRDPLNPEAAATDVEVAVDADGTIHASMTMPLGDEQEAVVVGFEVGPGARAHARA